MHRSIVHPHQTPHGAGVRAGVQRFRPAEACKGPHPLQSIVRPRQASGHGMSSSAPHLRSVLMSARRLSIRCSARLMIASFQFGGVRRTGCLARDHRPGTTSELASSDTRGPIDTKFIRNG
jgi:hypothetical protein